jgi:DNA mismatch repair protein MutS2
MTEAPDSRHRHAAAPDHHKWHGQWLGAFDEQVAEDLEFDVVRDMLAHHCAGPTATARAEQLMPMRARKRIVRELEETAELVRVRTEGFAFPGIHFEELTREIELLNVRGSVLDEPGFNNILQASRLANDLVDAMDGNEETLPRLAYLLRDIHATDELIEPIEAVFDERGQVRSDASNQLVKIREDMIRVRRALSRNFQRVLKDLLEKGWLADIKEGFVSERRVLAVNSTHKRKVPGTAMGTSKTGAITFIEPASNVPLNFEMEMLRDDERKEIQRILRDLTRDIRHHLPLIRAYQAALVDLDFIQAKSKLALALHASLPGLRRKPGCHLIEAYHPLLKLTNDSLGKRTEPQTLELRGDRRMLIISGPNAGGKSITLKTVGLLQLMLQSGLLIPVNPSSEVGLFDAILTDIGDNQSIENQLSTYSYRLKRMRGFLDVAGPTSLLLLDEFGTGSDPELGGALAEVFFEELYGRGSFGVITTHYANIKTRAAALDHALNGSMRFDRESLEPLYKLDVGPPGSSFTFEVAQINGIPADLIHRAKGKLDKRKVKLDELIGDLQKEKATLSRLTDRHLKREVELERLKAELADQQAAVEERAEAQHHVAEEQNVALNRGRKLNQWVDRYRAESNNKDLLEDVRKYLAVERAKRDDAAKLTAAKRKAAAARKPKNRPKHHIERIKVGSIVRLRNGGSERGEVIELTERTALVLFGAFKTRVELEKLSWVR